MNIDFIVNQDVIYHLNFFGINLYKGIVMRSFENKIFFIKQF
jgi:hypothetical protein